jgi:hypothetical protein
MPGRIVRRQAAINAVLVIVSLAIGLVALETAGRVVAATVIMSGKLFRPHPELGWTPLPDLDLVRRNANGDLWHIATDAEGIRGPSSWPDEEHTRLLILGDSFAFGEGVDLADRFDMIIRERVPSLAVLNLGVMGYGPDQELIRARPWKSQLRRGDALLLLTYHGNDFHDLVRTRHGGRSKPWIEEADRRLIEHEPAIDVFDHLRDRSYIFTLLTRSLARLDQSDHTERRLEGVDRLYQKWVSQQVEDLVARGVLVVIVHHGEGVRELPFEVEAVLASTCPAVSGCLALDRALASGPRDEVFLEDGHWAAGGHRIAAEQIAAWLRTLPGFGIDREQPDRPEPVLEDDEVAAVSPGRL